jgi:hypothetical protein
LLIHSRYRLFDLGVSNFIDFVKRLNNTSLSNELKIQCLVYIYDMMCNYSIHLPDRLQQSDLTLPKEVEIDLLTYVGKWHLSGHQEKCWSRFTLELLLGAGWTDGEILESLWSVLNQSKKTVRALSEAHRQEFLDELLQDSNFKKLCGGGKHFFWYECVVMNVL